MTKQSAMIVERQDELFVARAASTDEFRKHLQLINYEESRVWATDGKRVHMLNRPMGDVGQYVVKKVLKTRADIVADEDGLQPPNVDRVIPDKDVSLHADKSKGMFSQFYTRIVRTLPEDCTVDVEFLRDIPDGEWLVTIADKVIRLDSTDSTSTSDDNRYTVVIACARMD